MLSKKFALCQKQAASLIYLTLLRMDFFEAAHRWVGGGRGGGGEAKKHPFSCHIYPTIMKLGTVIPNLKKIQKIYESLDTPTGEQQMLLYQHMQI